MTRDERLEAWYNGDIEDDELTEAEVRDLEKRVFKAITRKTLERDDVHTFATHRTLQ